MLEAEPVTHTSRSTHLVAEEVELQYSADLLKPGHVLGWGM